MHCSDLTSFSKVSRIRNSIRPLGFFPPDLVTGSGLKRREDPLSFLKVCRSIHDNREPIQNWPGTTLVHPEMKEARGNVYSQPTRTWRPPFCHCPAAAGRGQTLVCSRQNGWPAALPWRSLEHNIYIFRSSSIKMNCFTVFITLIQPSG